MNVRSWASGILRRQQSSSKTDLDGDFASWEEAKAKSTGYDAEMILQKTCDALLEVKRGRATFERDSVLFEKPEHNWPLIAGLLLGAAESHGSLNVLDYGGSLGSTYFQNRRMLTRIADLRWNVVEQARHVEVGKSNFEDATLRFYESIDECLAATTPNTILLSSVLQYIEDPDAILLRLLNSQARVAIIDRTPFFDGPSNRLCVQHVPAEIYDASYPSWIFARSRFHSLIPAAWEVLAPFSCDDHLTGPVEFAYEGYILVRKAGVPELGMRSPVPSGVDQH